MPSDYARICSDNIAEYGNGTRHLAFLGRLYTDRTHFIFELLQNAEDARATKVRFSLFRTHLEMRHDGRPFNGKDVRGICGVDESTKAEDLNQIGKFGIGFKSVYAYTVSPEIHSVGGPTGAEHFCIEHYVRPRSCASKAPGKEWSTLLCFPFNKSNVSAEQAFKEIDDCLQTLSIRTLLFLRHIQDVDYHTANGASGAYVREAKDLKLAHQIIVSRQMTTSGKNDESEESEEWLVFQRPVQKNLQELVYVEIAFRLTRNEKTKQRTIKKIPYSPLTVFFETQKETKLGFLIQGTYRTTPARDNIPANDEWNKRLIKETATLIVESLSALKQMNLFSIDVLEAMPIRNNDFSSGTMFRPIFDAVQAVLATQPLLPTDSTEYIAAPQAKLARSADLRKLLSKRQLQQLYGSANALYWLSGEITADRTPDLHTYLTRTLGVEEVTPEKFAQLMREAFLKQQDDQWMIQFYAFLGTQESLWRKGHWHVAGPLRDKPIIRLEDATHVAPFKVADEPNAFLPSLASAGFPTVKSSLVAEEQALEFLKKLGLHEVDEKDIIERIINEHYNLDCPTPPRNIHLDHIKLFAGWYKVNRTLEPFQSLNHGHVIFLDKPESYFRAPSAYYLDLPFCDTNLSAIFEMALTETGDKHALWEGYQHIDGFVEFAKAIGVVYELAIVDSPIHQNPNYYDLLEDSWGTKRSSREIALDFTIPDLDFLLDVQQIRIGALIWELMRNADSRVLRAQYRPNAQYNLRTGDSLLVHTLCRHEWIPDREGNFRAPQDISHTELHPEFIYDDRNGWLTAIGFGTKAKEQEQAIITQQQHAEALGISWKTIELLREAEGLPELHQVIKDLLIQKKTKPTFPDRVVHNPERRQERVLANAQNAAEKQYEKRERSVRTSAPSIDPPVWLRQQYTNDDGEMVCQLCHDEMPFKKRNGDYYFEAVELFGDSAIEHVVQFVALCPLCAAMYQEFVKHDETTSEPLKRALRTGTSNPIMVQLGAKSAELRFVETHRHDLRTLLNKE